MLAAVNRAITCCGCAVIAPVVLATAWLVLGTMLPEKVFWYPIWLAAVVWNGRDGNGGISGLWE